MTKTEEILIGMLKENTGRHMLDSGGAYGRNWESNQKREFIDEPAVYLNFDTKYGYIEYEKNIFHFLNECLEYDTSMTNKFKRWALNKENEDRSWMELSYEFADWLVKRYGYDVENEGGCNTYNGDDMCSQVIQYERFMVDGVDYNNTFILLQIHGGCDIRGGYTEPKVFREVEEYGLFENNRGTIYCDGYGFNENQLCIDGINVVRCDAAWDNYGGEWENQYGGFGIQSLDWYFEQQLIKTDDDGNGKCPLCHTGNLLGY